LRIIPVISGKVKDGFIEIVPRLLETLPVIVNNLPDSQTFKALHGIQITGHTDLSGRINGIGHGLIGESSRSGWAMTL
jgi:hypothetical protein